MGLTENVRDLAKQAKETVVSALQYAADKRDIRNVLKRDHMLVAGMLEALLEKADEPGESLNELSESLRSELLLHSKAEEEVVYEACLKHQKDIKSFALEGFIEHSIAEDLVDRVLACRPGRDGKMRAALTVLKETLDHHVRDEEGDLFLKLQKHFSPEQLIQMGEKMEAIKSNIRIPSARKAKTSDEMVRH